MNLSDMLNVELYNDNLKMFYQAWWETLLALGKDLDEHILEKLYERQGETVYTHESRGNFIAARHCSEKGAEKLSPIEDNGQWHPRPATAEHVDFSKRAIKRQSSSSMLFERTWWTMQRLSVLDVEKLVPERRKMFIRLWHNTERKGKGNRSCRFVERDNSAERQYARNTWKSQSGKEDRPPCFNRKRGNCSHDRECDYWHPPHGRYCKKNTCQMWKDCPFTHSQKQNRSTSPKGSGKGT